MYVKHLARLKQILRIRNIVRDDDDEDIGDADDVEDGDKSLTLDSSGFRIQERCSLHE